MALELTQTFDSFWPAHATVLWATFALAIVMGAVVNKTNFCTMGAVSDWVNMGDKGRLRAWLFAMLVAVLGVMLLEYFEVFKITQSRPNYRGNILVWPEFILGGLMFGIGMTLGSGCGNKTLIRIGGGNIKSLLVYFVIGLCAYFMLNPFPGSDETLYGLLFYRWMNPLAWDMPVQYQDMGTILANLVFEKTKNANGDLVMSAENITMGRLIAGSLFAVVLALLIFISKDFFRLDNILAGIVVGLCVVGAWYVTSTFVSINADGDKHSWVSITNANTWSFLYDEGKPPQSVGTQSFSFINPMGESLRYASNGFGYLFLTFGVVAVGGIILGSLFWAVISRGFRFEWFVDKKDFLTHLAGAVLMGLGGVLALGCTIGQGITGISTLALGSVITFFSIVLGSALTMKCQYYGMLYGDEVSPPQGKAPALVSILSIILLVASVLAILGALGLTGYFLAKYFGSGSATLVGALMELLGYMPFLLMAVVVAVGGYALARALMSGHDWIRFCVVLVAVTGVMAMVVKLSQDVSALTAASGASQAMTSEVDVAVHQDKRDPSLIRVAGDTAQPATESTGSEAAGSKTGDGAGAQPQVADSAMDAEAAAKKQSIINWTLIHVAGFVFSLLVLWIFAGRSANAYFGTFSFQVFSTVLAELRILPKNMRKFEAL